MIPNTAQYWLTHARVPQSVLVGIAADFPTIRHLSQSSIQEDWVALDLEIRDDQITQCVPAGTGTYDTIPTVNLNQGIVFPCFVDLHTHLDKGHTWGRSPNPDGTFETALTVATTDKRHWNPEDLYRRMEFGVRCSYAHGTQAIRSHLDVPDGGFALSLDVFLELQNNWRDRVTLQPVALAPLDHYLTPEGEALAQRAAETGCVLGIFAVMHPDLDRQVDRMIDLAKDYQLDIDCHTDEVGGAESITLQYIAAAAIRKQFSRQIVCGHCCSLSLQTPEVAEKSMHLVKEAGIGIVSLPLCNVYLQDRATDTTPRWRGITLFHELRDRGIPIAVSSDNCRDPFHPFGDHDVLEVFSHTIRIAQIDRPYGQWTNLVTRTPADLMGLSHMGRIGVGLSADLILFQARTFSELLSRSQHNRVVIRKGKAIDTTLPDYRELDDLVFHQV